MLSHGSCSRTSPLGGMKHITRKGGFLKCMATNLKNAPHTTWQYGGVYFPTLQNILSLLLSLNLFPFPSSPTLLGVPTLLRNRSNEQSGPASLRGCPFSGLWALPSLSPSQNYLSSNPSWSFLHRHTLSLSLLPFSPFSLALPDFQVRPHPWGSGIP